MRSGKKVAKGGERGLSLLPSPSLCFCSQETTSSSKSPDKYLCFLNLEAVTHLFSTAGHFLLLTVQMVLQRTPSFKKNKLWLRSLSPGNFSGDYEPEMYESRKCLSHLWPSRNLLGQYTWHRSVGGTLCELACRSEPALPRDIGATYSLTLWESSHKLFVGASHTANCDPCS